MITRLVRSWAGRVAIVGVSMAPTLLDGDWLLADPDAYRNRSPRAGDLVVVPDPREPSRLLVKRVEQVDPDGWLRLAGDAPAASTDSRTFGSVDPSTVEAQPWFRYWPPHKLGPIA
jgi:nickel-type superoxide dismutase maturation protease